MYIPFGSPQREFIPPDVVGAVDTSGLSGPQIAALRVLFGVGGIGDAAAAAGVTPRSVYRWMRCHRGFKDAIKAAGDKLLEASLRYRRECLDEQFRPLREGLAAGDRQAALAVLHLMVEMN
jgi:hypothetical protein